MKTASFSCPPNVRIYPGKTCLVSELSATLAQRTSKDLAETLVVLPTHRMGQLVAARIVALKGASLCPTFMTMSEWIEFLNPTADADPELASELDEELILQRILAENAFRHLGSGHELAIRKFYAEILASGKSLNDLAELPERLRAESLLSTAGSELLAERIVELGTVLAEFTARLRRLRLTTAVERKRRAIELILEKAGISLQRNFQRTFMVGFSNSSQIDDWLWLDIGRRLIESQIEVWLSRPCSLARDVLPVDSIIEALGVQRHPCSTASEHVPLGRIYMQRQTSLRGEIKAALTEAMARLQQGYAPGTIGIIVTDESLYAETFAAEARDLGLPLNLTLAIPLGKTVPGMWLKLLAELVRQAHEPADYLILTHFLQNPLTKTFIRRAETKDAPDRANPDIWLRDLLDALANHLLPRSFAALTGESAPLRVLSRALATLLGTERRLSLSEWAQTVGKIFAEFWAVYAATDNETSPCTDEDLHAAEALQTFLQNTARSHIAQTGILSAAEGLQLLAKKQALEEIRFQGHPLAGVQVLSLAEARQVPLRLAIILGCAEGILPRSIPPDLLLDPFLKRLLGLRSYQDLELLEDQTVHLLLERYPETVLSYPAYLGSQEMAPSRYLAWLARSGYATMRPSEANVEPSESSEQGSGLVEPQRHFGAEGHTGTAVEVRPASISASSLRTLLQCPYAFHLKSLQLDEWQLPSTVMSPRAEGILLHRVLHAFFSDEIRRRAAHAPKNLAILREEFLRDRDGRKFQAGIEAALCSWTYAVFPNPWQRTTFAHALAENGWARLSAFLAERLTGASVSWQSEWRFEGANTPWEPGFPAFHGSLDFAMTVDHDCYIVDFKKSTVPAKRDVALGFEPQLTIYGIAALAHLEALRSTGKILHLGYWDLSKGEWQEILQDNPEAPMRMAGKPWPLAEAESLLQQNFTWRRSDIKTLGRLYADPSACGLCAYASLCRRDDPMLQEHFAQQFRRRWVMDALLSAEGARP